MLPMRSVPHRVVCLLGVDDGVFPRRPEPDGDNIVGDEEWIGDHDVRSEDRQLLLDAVMSARDRLVVIFAGADPRSGSEIPTAVPIGELLDGLDATARTEDGETIRSKITTRHPLQPFDTVQLRPWWARLPGTIQLRSGESAGRTRRRSGPPSSRTGLRPRPLPERADDGLVSLNDLVRFYNHPIRALPCRARVWITRSDEAPDEQIPVNLTGLDNWSVGDRLLRLRLAGHAPELLTAAEWRRGYLPPRGLGQRAIQEITDQSSSWYRRHSRSSPTASCRTRWWSRWKTFG